MSLSYHSISKAPTLPDYIFGEKIGSGSYGTVYKAVKKTGSTECVAVKVVRKTSLTASSTENLISEISALKKLHHAHIVTMHHFTWDASNIYIVMEYCGGGDLAAYLSKCCHVNEPVARLFLQQLASALAYMHNHQISHLDLKPPNILLTTLPSLKIADFGFAQHWRGATQADEIRGSLLYMAPEMLVHGCYGDKADLWSVGVILYECLFGQAPFMSSTLQELKVKITSLEPVTIPHHPHTTSDCKDLLTSLLVRDPLHRLTFPRFIHHPFLHPPPPLNLARELAGKAAQLHKQGDIQSSFDTYCEALQCYMDALKSEQVEHKKISLREKVNEYIEKAEELKGILNSQQQQKSQQQQQQQNLQQQKSQQQQQNLQQQNQQQQNQQQQNQQQQSLRQQQQHPPSYVNPIDELSLLWQDNQQMIDALNVIKSAQVKLEMEDFKSSLERYEAAIGVILKLVKNQPPSRKTELLHSQLSDWLSRAGRLKNHVILSRAKMGGADDDDLHNKSTCMLQ